MSPITKTSHPYLSLVLAVIALLEGTAITQSHARVIESGTTQTSITAPSLIGSLGNSNVDSPWTNGDNTDQETLEKKDINQELQNQLLTQNEVKLDGSVADSVLEEAASGTGQFDSDNINKTAEESDADGSLTFHEAQLADE
jgi:hypothetical protein